MLSRNKQTMRKTWDDKSHFKYKEYLKENINCLNMNDIEEIGPAIC